MSTLESTRTVPDYSQRGPEAKRPVPRNRAASRAARLPLIVLLIVAMIGAGFIRDGALNFQARAAGPYAPQSRSALGNMNSFALALMLGGLRGPLVMMLWSTSEAQKADKDLEDFNTKVEWIRNLQPEFVTVHLFQIWNLAYNVSVQMASLPNRYACIMEALDYARNVDRGRPDSLDIQHAIAQVYSNKLGTLAQEKTYYRARIREDSLPRKMTGPKFGEAGFQRRRMDPILDDQFNVRPEYLVIPPGHERPADLPADAEWNLGQDLQYLKQYEPFPSGVSTYALAYNYAKRAEVLMNVWHQQPLQMSEMVIDSRPALELQTWAAEEWERGRRSELEALGQKVPPERVAMEAPTAATPPDAKVVSPEELKKAIYTYELMVRLCKDARAEYDRHLNKIEYVSTRASRESMLQALDGMEQLAAGDAAYLRAVSTSDEAKKAESLKAAAAAYRQATSTYEMIVLRHYLPDELTQKLFHASKTAITTDKFTNAQRHTYYREAKRQLANTETGDTDDDRREYDAYITRAEARLAQIDPASAGQPDKTTQPTPGGDSSQPQPTPVAPPAPPQPPKP